MGEGNDNMAQRIMDGARVFNEPWDAFTREVFIWLLFRGADSLGMQTERPASIAEELSDGTRTVDAAAVTVAIDVLCAGDKPTLIRYTHGGKRFLMFRKWQDHQKIRYPVKPVCPQPPQDALAGLSESTQALLRSNYSNSSVETTVTPTARKRATVSVSVSASVTAKKDNGLAPDAEAPTPPKRKFTDEENAYKDARLEHWDVCLKHYYGGAPVKFTEGGQAAKFFAGVARDGVHPAELVDKAINAYFREKESERKYQREAAQRRGEEPKAVAVRFGEFQTEFPAQLDKVRK
jgi:hypothetical protein